MLLRAERISEATVSKLLTWNPTGFSAWLGDPIYPNPDEHAWRKRLARYLIKNPVSLERLAYDDSTCILTYTSHQRGQSKTFTALDFIAELSVHIPDRKRHCAVYLGRCSNRLRGERRKAAGQALPMLNTIPQPSRATIIDSDNPWDVESPKLQRSRKAFRIAWATLLKQVWNVDVNICKQCCAPAKIIAAVTQLRVVERILTHLGLFERPRAPTNHHCPNTLTQRQYPHQAFCFQEVDAPQQFDERDTHLNTLWVADPPFAED